MDFDAIITGIRKAIYGREVREYIASSMEWTRDFVNQSIANIKELLRQAEAARDAAKASADKSAASATESANSAMESKRSADASAKSATASANSANESAGYASDSANSANESAGYASDSAASAAASEASAKNSANAAMKALQEAADSGAFKGDKGDTGPQGPSGTANASEINAGILGISYGGTGCSTALDACETLLWRGDVPKNQDWNDLTTGVWMVIPDSFGSNSPSGIYTYGAVIVFNIAGSCTQVYVAHNTGAMMFRQRFSNRNNFSGWARVNTGDTLSAYPVGAIYISTSSTSPASLFGGTWESIASERVLMGVSSSHGAGSTVSAGLPDIVGETTAMATWRFVTPSGAFATASSQPGPDGYANNLGLNVNFYASRCSSVYGNSSTVQPAAYYVYMWRRTA